MDFILLIIWFILLIKWADILVDWAASIAKKHNISPLVIWLTIVAFWTSAPELVVNILSAYSWNTDLAISNIIWSNISNIFLILWITAIIYPIAIPNSAIKKEIPFLIMSSIILMLLLLDGILTRADAWILAILFAGFLYYTYNESKKKSLNINNEIKEISNLKAIIFVILWLTWLIIWGKFIVNSAVNIAQSYWLPESFIGITIVAIWTSLPELAASVTAALKKQTDMALGWVIGSNIFNTLWILWATGLIHPMKGYQNMKLDLSIEIIASFLIFFAAFTMKKYMISKTEGILLVLFYISYIWYLSYINI